MQLSLLCTRCLQAPDNNSNEKHQKDSILFLTRGVWYVQGTTGTPFLYYVKIFYFLSGLGYSILITTVS